MRAASYSLPVFRCSDVTRTTGASGNLSCRNGKKKSKHSRLKAIRAIKGNLFYFYIINVSRRNWCNTLLIRYYPLVKQQIVSFFDSFWSPPFSKNCSRVSAYGFSCYVCCALVMISVIFSDTQSYFATNPWHITINNIVIKEYMETSTTKIQEQKVKVVLFIKKMI